MRLGNVDIVCLSWGMRNKILFFLRVLQDHLVPPANRARMGERYTVCMLVIMRAVNDIAVFKRRDILDWKVILDLQVQRDPG
jgi:hypothetical protein